MAWSPDRVETLRAMWLEGYSALQIAKELGNTSRNAVIGKAKRLKLFRNLSNVNKQKDSKTSVTNVGSNSHNKNTKIYNYDNSLFSSIPQLQENKNVEENVIPHVDSEDLQLEKTKGSFPKRTNRHLQKKSRIQKLASIAQILREANKDLPENKKMSEEEILFASDRLLTISATDYGLVTHRERNAPNSYYFSMATDYAIKAKSWMVYFNEYHHSNLIEKSSFRRSSEQIRNRLKSFGIYTERN